MSARIGIELNGERDNSTLPSTKRHVWTTHKKVEHINTDTKVVPIESVLRLGLEEVHQEEKLIRGRVHQVLQHGAQQHFERKALVFSLGHVHQNGLPLNLSCMYKRIKVSEHTKRCNLAAHATVKIEKKESKD